MSYDFEISAYQGVPWGEAPQFYAAYEKVEALKHLLTEQQRARIEQSLHTDLLRNLYEAPVTGQIPGLAVYGRFHSSAHTLKQIRPDFLWDRNGNLLVDEQEATLLMPSGKVCAEDLRVCPGAAWGSLHPRAVYELDSVHRFIDVLRIWCDSQFWIDAEWQPSINKANGRSIIGAILHHLLVDQGLLRLQGSSQPPTELIEAEIRTVPSQLLMMAIEDWVKDLNSTLTNLLEHYLEDSWPFLRLLPAYLAEPQDTEHVGAFVTRFRTELEPSGKSLWDVCYDNASHELDEELEEIRLDLFSLSDQYGMVRPLWDNPFYPELPSWGQPEFDSSFRPEPEDKEAEAFRHVQDIGGTWFKEPWAEEFSRAWMELENRRDELWCKLEQEVFAALSSGQLTAWGYDGDSEAPRLFTVEELQAAPPSRLGPGSFSLDDWPLGSDTRAKLLRFYPAEDVKSKTGRSKPKRSTNDVVERRRRKEARILDDLFEREGSLRTASRNVLADRLHAELPHLDRKVSVYQIRADIEHIAEKSNGEGSWEIISRYNTRFTGPTEQETEEPAKKQSAPSKTGKQAND